MVREAGPEKSLIFVRAGLCTCYVHIWRKQTKVDVQLEGSLYDLHIVGVSGRANGEDGGGGIWEHNFPSLILFYLNKIITLSKDGSSCRPCYALSGRCLSSSS